MTVLAAAVAVAAAVTSGIVDVAAAAVAATVTVSPGNVVDVAWIAVVVAVVVVVAPQFGILFLSAASIVEVVRARRGCASTVWR